MGMVDKKDTENQCNIWIPELCYTPNIYFYLQYTFLTFSPHNLWFSLKG
jgi:hypothetical protein